MQTINTNELGKRGRRGSKFDAVVAGLQAATMPTEEGQVLAEDVTDIVKQPSQIRQYLDKHGLKDSFRAAKLKDRILLVRTK